MVTYVTNTNCTSIFLLKYYKCTALNVFLYKRMRNGAKKNRNCVVDFLLQYLHVFALFTVFKIVLVRNVKELLNLLHERIYSTVLTLFFGYI